MSESVGSLQFHRTGGTASTDTFTLQTMSLDDRHNAASGGAGGGTPPISMDTVSSIVGLPDFVEPYNDKCNICNEPLLDPFQTRCGHRLCRNCLVNHHEKNGDPTMCPYNEEDCEVISLKNNDGSVYPDFYLLKQLKKKQVYCTFKQLGCTVIVPLGKLQNHIQLCEFGKVHCPNASLGCPEKLSREALEEHIKQCLYIPVICNSCKSPRIAKALMEEHLEKECEMVRVSCPYNCGETNIIRRDLPQHKEACPLKPINCSYMIMGCKFKGSVEMVGEHEQTDTSLHLELLRDHLLKVEAKLGTTLEDMEKQLESSPAANASTFEKIDENLKRHEQKLLRQENRIKETQKTVAKQAQTLMEIHADGASNRAPGNTTGTDSQLADVLRRVTTLETTQGTVRGIMQKLEDQFRTQTVKYAEYDLRFQVLETASYNGILLWKIRDYKRRKEDAKNGGVLSLYSQAFYTSRHGYRMCARVYLNGDGMGAGSHLSLFFVIMRGEYDPLLKWPFKQKVSLMLLDQVGHTRHIQDTFRPDPSSSSFQQPRSDMNIASGCPLFVSHAVLEAKDSLYLRDDTIFLKIVCDRDGLQIE